MLTTQLLFLSAENDNCALLEYEKFVDLCVSVTERLCLVSASALTVERVLALWRRDDSQPARRRIPRAHSRWCLRCRRWSSCSSARRATKRRQRARSCSCSPRSRRSDAVHRLLTCFRQPQHYFAQRWTHFIIRSGFLFLTSKHVF